MGRSDDKCISYLFSDTFLAVFAALHHVFLHSTASIFF